MSIQKAIPDALTGTNRSAEPAGELRVQRRNPTASSYSDIAVQTIQIMILAASLALCAMMVSCLAELFRH
jgi:hypothetical protein